MRAAWYVGGAVWFLALYASIWLWGEERNDPFAMIFTVLRIAVIVPVATLLALGSVKLWDRYTAGDYEETIVDPKADSVTKFCCALVLGALIFGVFWLAIQG